MKMYAMANSRGIACAETAICGKCDTPDNRRDIKRDCAHAEYVPGDAPSQWRDCSDNDALECTMCGDALLDGVRISMNERDAVCALLDISRAFARSLAERGENLGEDWEHIERDAAALVELLKREG